MRPELAELIMDSTHPWIHATHQGKTLVTRHDLDRNAVPDCGPVCRSRRDEKTVHSQPDEPGGQEVRGNLHAPPGLREVRSACVQEGYPHDLLQVSKLGSDPPLGCLPAPMIKPRKV